MCATLNADWTKARRDDIHPSLPEDFKRLASAEVKVSPKFPFGDDLENTIKSLESHNQLTKKMDKPDNQKSGKPYPNEQLFQQRQPFKQQKDDNKGFSQRGSLRS